jgi:transposase
VDTNGNPVRIAITKGTTADCTQAIPLIEGIIADSLLVDKAYDTNEIIEYAKGHDMTVVIPPKSNRKVKREYDKHLYKLRHIVENTILKLKRLRGVATRYAKTTISFHGTVVLASILQ